MHTGRTGSAGHLQRMGGPDPPTAARTVAMSGDDAGDHGLHRRNVDQVLFHRSGAFHCSLAMGAAQKRTLHGSIDPVRLLPERALVAFAAPRLKRFLFSFMLRTTKRSRPSTAPTLFVHARFQFFQTHLQLHNQLGLPQYNIDQGIRVVPQSCQYLRG